MGEGAERIIRRILDDANSKAVAIKAAAKEKSTAVENEAKQKAARKQEQILEKASKEAEEQKRRIIGVAQLEARKELLAAKQELISEVFQKSLNQLVDMDERLYLATIRDLILKLVETGTETVLGSAIDRDRIPAVFWKEINETLVKQGKKGELKLSVDTRDIRGGFILQAEGVEINCSFESLLEMKRDQLEPEVAAVLFK
ncbi:MAG: V-type proton ATPase subunit E [Clostridia bacterium]|nr:V-type proton ATPase subunit E [Clostridia bacterium]